MIPGDDESFYAKEIHNGKWRRYSNDLKIVLTADPSTRFKLADQPSTVDELNKLKADLLKAKLKGDKAKVSELEHEFAEKEKAMVQSEKERLRVLDTRFVDRGADKKPEDKTIADMVREEINARQRGDRHDEEEAKVIAATGAYENDEDYMFDNAEALAGVAGKQRSTRKEEEARAKQEARTRNRLVEQSRKEHEAVDFCPLCLDEGKASGFERAATVSVATRTHLSLAPSPAMAKGSVVIAPLEHRRNTLECDDDEWEELRNFMKALTAMWARHGKAVLFYEDAVDRSVRAHAHIYAVPVPRSALSSAPGFFGEAFKGGEDEWRSHRDVVDTLSKSQTAGKYAFRSSIAKEAPYFHAWFDINGGAGHVVEDTRAWPKNDRFARSILAGMLDSDPILPRQSTRWDVPIPERDYFEKRWRDYDWTRDIQW